MSQLYTYKSTVLKVIDGDTVDLIVDLGFFVKTQIRTRVMGVNAPELRTEEGRKVRDEVRAWLPEQREVLVTTFKDPGDKYGRWLARIEKDGESLASWLLKNGYATNFGEQM